LRKIKTRKLSMKILANDGIDLAGKALLEKAGYEVVTEKVPQEMLVSKIGEYDGILVRSATTVTREIIEASSRLKVIGRAGVGTDNIDKVAAAEKGIPVLNTPAASSVSVAELVFAHLFSGVRFLHKSNRLMPTDGLSKFNALKKEFAKATELKGKTLGIIGFGGIGKETAKIAIGLGMNILVHDDFAKDLTLTLAYAPQLSLPSVTLTVKSVSMETLLKQSDFVTLHVPKLAAPVIGSEQIAMMKEGAGIVNCARGGIIDEKALAEALRSGKLAFAGLDVFEIEPPVDPTLLQLENVSLTPHCGGSTQEAQERIAIELSEKVIAHLSSSALA